MARTISGSGAGFGAGKGGQRSAARAVFVLPPGLRLSKIAPHLQDTETNMSTFETAADVKDFNKYKAGTKAALGRLSGSSAVKYLYFHKFKFDDKERPLLLVDFDDSLTKSLGATISEGKCKLDDHDRITFEAKKGVVDVDKVAHLFSSIGISRAVARPDEPAPSASARPEGDKLNMTAGFTEMFNWGADAAKLVEKFEGLVGLYKGLPEIKPEAKELFQKHAAIKLRMAELIKLKISNTDKERAEALEKVKALRKDVEALNLEARKPTPKPTPKPTATPKVETKPTAVADKSPPTTPKQEPAQDTAKATTTVSPKAEKPELTAEAIRTAVRSTPSLGEKDTAEKYLLRLKRTLPDEYRGITDKHYDAIKGLAEATYFKKSKEQAKPTAKAKDGPTPLTEQQARAIDAAMQAAVDAAGANDMIDNDAQVALGDGITHAIGGSNPTHSRGGGHRGSFNKDVTIQQALSNIGRILQAKTRESINLHFSTAWRNYSI